MERRGTCGVPDDVEQTLSGGRPCLCQQISSLCALIDPDFDDFDWQKISHEIEQWKSSEIEKQVSVQKSPVNAAADVGRLLNGELRILTWSLNFKSSKF